MKVVLVWALDRFGRSLSHLVMALEELSSLGVDFLSYRDGIDTSTPVGRMVFGILGSVAQFERDRLRERVYAGLRTARAKGVKLGRRRVTFSVSKAHQMKQQGKSLTQIGKALGVSRETVRKELAAWQT